jgi:hypothetical protein
MISKVPWAALYACLLIPSGLAQDPTKVEPKHYQLAFENEIPAGGQSTLRPARDIGAPQPSEILTTTHAILASRAKRATLATLQTRLARPWMPRTKS